MFVHTTKSQLRKIKLEFSLNGEETKVRARLRCANCVAWQKGFFLFVVQEGGIGVSGSTENFGINERIDLERLGKKEKTRRAKRCRRVKHHENVELLQQTTNENSNGTAAKNGTDTC